MKRYLIAVIVSCLVPAYAGTVSSCAQTVADSLRKAYDFPQAVAWCRDVLSNASPEEAEGLETEFLLARNGLSMMNYCSQPVVVARYQFALEDFFLYYPMRNRSWHPLPNALDSLSNEPLVRATFAPEGAQTLYYSAPDAEGIRNLYRTHLKDSLWTVPELINEALTSSANEIYPVLDGDGKTLYFASQGLYGMGGYDLYRSSWNEETQDWDTPVNMGFPYSSPYDDFLYFNTDDGRYSVFASNRGCSSDSVYVYVLEYDDMPVRRAVESVEELRAVAALAPQDDPSKMNTSSAVSAIETEDAGMREYMARMEHVRGLRDTISAFQAQLEKLRAELRSDAAGDKNALTQEILNREIALPGMQSKLERAVRDLQKTEMEFLMSGVAINPDKLKAEADREVVGASSNYALSRNEMGPGLAMSFEKARPLFDYSLKILPEGQFAEDGTLPDGLVYQIQIFVTSKKAGVEQLKGLSPVFEREKDGRYTYSAGLFKSYNDVLSQLNLVKRQGFRTAIITAARDGAQIPVPEARALEASIYTLYKIHVEPSNGQTLPEAAVKAIHQATEHDIVRMLDGSRAIFEIGPFDSLETCTALVRTLRDLGLERVTVIEAGKTIAENGE